MIDASWIQKPQSHRYSDTVAGQVQYLFQYLQGVSEPGFRKMRLIVLPSDFERYEQFSHWMFGYGRGHHPLAKHVPAL
jgi:hypothetical protein